MFNRLLDRLELRYGRYNGIRNLMTYIVAAMAVVFVSDLVLLPMMQFSLSSWISFDLDKILSGQIWRVVTFIFLPPSDSIIFILFSLLFYNFLGQMLQSHWGNLRFNVFYFTGMLGSIIAGLITGYATNYYLNLSLFLALALLYPEMSFNIYGIFSVKAKWLALVDLVLILPSLITGTWAMRIAILVSFANVALFFYERGLRMLRDAQRRREWRRNWRR